MLTRRPLVAAPVLLGATLAASAFSGLLETETLWSDSGKGRCMARWQDGKTARRRDGETARKKPLGDDEEVELDGPPNGRPETSDKRATSCRRAQLV